MARSAKASGCEKSRASARRSGARASDATRAAGASAMAVPALMARVSSRPSHLADERLEQRAAAGDRSGGVIADGEERADQVGRACGGEVADLPLDLRLVADER